MALYEPSRARWEPMFDEAAKVRDILAKGTAEYRQAQKEVERCYDEMYSQGYFRYSYNDWNLLWMSFQARRPGRPVNGSGQRPAQAHGGPRAGL